MRQYIFFLLFPSLVWPQPNGRIIGGHNAYAAQFPFAAAIYKTTLDGNYFCVGSLITNQWVLTSGQCVDEATLFTILLGTNFLSDTTENVKKLATDSYVLHPEFDPASLANDVGLIKFRTPVIFSEYISPADLPVEDLVPNTRALAYGWGQTSDDQSDLSDDLKYAVLFSVSDDTCKKTYGSQIKENMVCFVGNYNEGTCHGDGGSPVLQLSFRGYTTVIGVASFFSGNGCESTDPSGYVKIFPYLDWIRNITA